jgi:type II secretory pathway component PulF
MTGSWKRGSSGRSWFGVRADRTPNGANRSVLGDAKAILFGELAECVRSGMDLPEALKLVGQSWHRHEGKPFHIELGAPDSHFPTFIFLIRLPILLVMSMWGLLWRNPRRVARLTARRLALYVEQGHSLSLAMSSCGAVFTPEEIRLIRFGEEQTSLARSLDSLHGFHHVERQAMAAINGVYYPVVLLLILVQLTAFILMVITPKFQDIFQQMGSELPYWTMVFIDISQMVTGEGSFILSGLILVLLWCLCCARLLNGNLWSAYLSLAVFLIGFLIFFPFNPLLRAIFGSFSREFSDALGRAASSPGGLLVILAIPVVILMMRRRIARTWENFLRTLEGWVMSLGRLIPVLRGALHQEDQSRWLGALSATLGAGMPLPEALNEVAEIAPRRLLRNTTRVAEEVTRGMTLGQALERWHVLSPSMIYRLDWLEREGRLVEELPAISADARDLAADSLTRAARATEVFGTIAVGFLFALVVIAMYLPLFAIPGLVSPNNLP